VTWRGVPCRHKSCLVSSPAVAVVAAARLLSIWAVRRDDIRRAPRHRACGWLASNSACSRWLPLARVRRSARRNVRLRLGAFALAAASALLYGGCAEAAASARSGVFSAYRVSYVKSAPQASRRRRLAGAGGWHPHISRGGVRRIGGLIFGHRGDSSIGRRCVALKTACFGVIKISGKQYLTLFLRSAASSRLA